MYEFLKFDIGNVFTILSFLGGGIAFAYTIRGDVRSLQLRLQYLEEEIRKVTDVLVTLARQDERLNAMARRLDCMQDKLDEK